LRIAQVAPLIESVPPSCYGGTERVVHHLTEELVRMGHDVTLFASGDSHTSARLIAARPRAVRLDGGDQTEAGAAHALMVELLMECVERGDFDIVHLHTDWLAWSLLSRLSQPFVTTMHGRMDHASLPALFGRLPDAPLVSISRAHRAPVPRAPWAATIHHGLPSELYRPGQGSGGYLAFLGRLSPEKRPDLAIAIAERAGVPLKIAAKIDPSERDYFKQEIEPLLNNPLVQFVGEITDAQKEQFLGDALGLIFPIQWPEPFGLVMIEALACGTPVVAFNAGSVPEVIRHGATGFVVENVDDAVEAVARLPELSRRACRLDFEQRFSARRMAEQYLDVYTRLIEARVIFPQEGVATSLGDVAS
jgi:glycosyltransferase involved in cell wall biosynthesis